MSVCIGSYIQGGQYRLGNWFVFYVQTGKEQTACDLLNKLFDDEYIIEDFVGFIKEDKMLGPLQARESVIRKIDIHKRCAKLELELMGDKRIVEVALKIVSKV